MLWQRISCDINRNEIVVCETDPRTLRASAAAHIDGLSVVDKGSLFSNGEPRSQRRTKRRGHCQVFVVSEEQIGSRCKNAGVRNSKGSASQRPRAAPTVSAMCAPRTPIGFGEPVVVSRAVWCSISALSSAPSRIAIAEIQSHVINPTAPPSEPYVSLNLPKLAAYQEKSAEAPSQSIVAATLPHVIHLQRGASPKADRVEVDKTRQTVRLFDKSNALIGFYPATVGSEEKPSPSGTLKVTEIDPNPTYRYNPHYHFKGVHSRKPFTIKPGPNNPVGTIWINLSADGYGIHGTPSPGKVSKAESHGCVRLRTGMPNAWRIGW